MSLARFGAPRLVLRGVGRTYPGTPPVPALVGVDLDVTDGEFLCLVGPSGSGKSTLLNVIALLDRATTGSYEVGGHEVVGLSERRRSALRATTFGFVFQRFHLVERYTAQKNVELGLLYQGTTRRERRTAAAAAVDRVGLATRAGHRADALSGGERQRVAIARAVVGGAPILVADEPTGNLDSAASDSIVRLLGELNDGGTTIVLVTHDPEVARAAGRIVQLSDGELVGVGG